MKCAWSLVSRSSAMMLSFAAVAPSLASAQSASNLPAEFCPSLQRVTALAIGQDRFQSITGKPREGSYSDTTVSLPGWRDCSLYGSRTYACDSRALPSADKAREEQSSILREVAACLGEGWTEDRSRSSPVYVILHQRGSKASITLSTDQNEKDEHVVRLILFLR